MQDAPVGTYRATTSPAGGFRIDIVIQHYGAAKLIDFYQVTASELEPTLLHPDRGPVPFTACPSASAPGWTNLGSGLEPGDEAGPFIAWCAAPPPIFEMRWCAEDPAIGGPFQICHDPTERKTADVPK